MKILHLLKRIPTSNGQNLPKIFTVTLSFCTNISQKPYCLLIFPSSSDMAEVEQMPEDCLMSKCQDSSADGSLKMSSSEASDGDFDDDSDSLPVISGDKFNRNYFTMTYTDTESCLEQRQPEPL